MKATNNHNFKNARKFFAVIAVAFFSACTAQQAMLNADEKTKQMYHADKIVDYLNTLSEPSMPGFSYLVSKNGKIIASGGLGLADVEGKVPNDITTIFRVASITKQFTAISILQLSEQGKLSLNDPLGKYFPDLPGAQKITLRNLLDHTSGMWEQEKDEDFPFPYDQLVSVETHLSYIQKNPVFFQPNEKWGYCSNGYFVLGLIVEKVSGLSLENYMQRYIFKPLGMKNTGLYDNDVNYDHSAIGYGIEDGVPVTALKVNMKTYSGAADLYSTVEDLFIWNEALHNGKVVSQESYQDAVTPHKFTNGFVPFVPYGLGFGIEQLSGHLTIGHPGTLTGYHSDILRLPTDKVNIIFLSNVNKWQFKTEARVAEHIISLMYGD